MHWSNNFLKRFKITLLQKQEIRNAENKTQIKTSHSYHAEIAIIYTLVRVVLGHFLRMYVHVCVFN